MEDMETNILNIINLINEKNSKSLQKGLDLLQDLFSSILPQIEQQKHLPIKTGKVGRFIKLQDNFRFNIASKLAQCHEFLYDNIVNLPLEMIIQFTKLFQGLLLIHGNSRSIFTSDYEMTKVLKFIELDNDSHPYEITISFISLLLHILLKNLDNFRVFEQCNGCSIIIKKLNLEQFQMLTSEPTEQQTLNFKIIEFLIFYFNEEDDYEFKKTTEEKAELFKKDFAGIDMLIESLNDLKNLT